MRPGKTKLNSNQGIGSVLDKGSFGCMGRMTQEILAVSFFWQCGCYRYTQTENSKLSVLIYLANERQACVICSQISGTWPVSLDLIDRHVIKHLRHDLKILLIEYKLHEGRTWSILLTSASAIHHVEFDTEWGFSKQKPLYWLQKDFLRRIYFLWSLNTYHKTLRPFMYVEKWLGSGILVFLLIDNCGHIHAII